MAVAAFDSIHAFFGIILVLFSLWHGEVLEGVVVEDFSVLVYIAATGIQGTY